MEFVIVARICRSVFGHIDFRILDLPLHVSFVFRILETSQFQAEGIKVHFRVM